MKHLKTIKDCWHEWWNYIIPFWSTFGFSGVLGTIEILSKYQQWYSIFMFGYFLFIIVIPFVYYGIYYEKRIKILEKDPRCKIDNKDILSFDVYGDKNTISNFKFRVGVKVSSYYLFFTKISDIQMEFMLPNKRFKLIRKNKDFHIIKCERNERKNFFFPISSKNRVGESFSITFEIFYSKEKTLEDGLKNKKRIYEGQIECNP